MLETIRAYALEQLAAHGAEREVRDRHAAYFLALTEKASVGIAGPGQADWLRRLALERDNLSVALDHLLARGDAASAAQIGWNLSWFWFIRGHATEGRAWMARVLTCGTALAPTERGRALASSGMLAFLQGDFAEAAALLDEAAGLAEGVAERALVAQVLLARSIVALGRGDAARTVADATRGAALFAALGDRWGEGLALLNLLHAAASTGDLARAARLLETAEMSLRAAGAPWGIAYALNMRVLLAQLAGDLAATIAPAREGIARSVETGDLIALYYGLTGVAAASIAGDGERAARLFGAAEALRKRTGLVMPNPANQLLYEQHVAALRAQLAPERLAAAWAAGRALPLDEAIREATMVET